MKTNPYIIDYYNNYDEDSRLSPRHGTVEFLTTMRYIEKYIKPGSYTASQNILLENLGDVGGSWTQSAEGTRYSDSSGNNVVNGWQIIVGQWYYFDDNGYAVTGWQRINGQWYYFKENHTMATGWVQADGRWYYMTSDGTMKTGWHQEVPGVWYYFNDDGSMATDTHIGEYYVGPDGIYVP